WPSTGARAWKARLLTAISERFSRTSSAAARIRLRLGRDLRRSLDQGVDPGTSYCRRNIMMLLREKVATQQLKDRTTSVPRFQTITKREDGKSQSDPSNESRPSAGFPDSRFCSRLVRTQRESQTGNSRSMSR